MEEVLETKTVVGVRFKQMGRMYYFDPGELEIKEGDGAIVETARGVEFADVVMSPKEVPLDQIVAPLKSVIRVATPGDWEMRRKNAEKEKDAYAVCSEKIRQHQLDMKLVDVEYTFNGSKVTFFFTAEGRVDFRELVKDLAYVFKTRIELRQIGVRDEAKMLGGLGSCGRPVCCKAFLEDFQPVSIKMAKEQNLSLSPAKISGLCGRLMCCLKYEQDAYEQMRKVMPKLNKEVMTPDGPGIVQDNNAITEKTRVRVALPDGTYDMREYHFSQVRKPQPGEEYVPPVPKSQPEPPEEKEEKPKRERPPRPKNPARVRKLEDAQSLKPLSQQGEAKTEQKQKKQPVQKGAEQEKAAEEKAASGNKPRSRNRRGGRNRKKAANSQAGQPQAAPQPQEGNV